MINRVQNNDSSQDTLEGNEQRNNVIESNSPNKLIALESELGLKAN